jgi:hypothetical protein
VEADIAMSTYYHDAIVVVGIEADEGEDTQDTVIAHRIAKGLGLIVTEIAGTQGEIHSSFMICPDGAKEGSARSEEHDVLRDSWKLSVQKAGLLVDWCHVRLGGDFIAPDGQTAEIVDCTLD